MAKKVVVVSSTPRKGGNSLILAQEFARGAREAGNEVVEIDVGGLGLRFCIGCMRCHETNRCVINDGMNALYDSVQGADVLAFATPVYYYSMSGQLKTFLDRLNPLYVRKNRFRDVYLLAAAADGDERAVDGTVTGIEGWIACFEGVRLAGVVRGVGAEGAGEVRGTKAALAAYEAGKAV